MDQEKIGKYIAEKRKQLGLTQIQLAEQLGMSNKSVSKWERGVCLPDVSVYKKLCEVLGISLNEFLAGEDLSVEEAIPKSEDTIIGITEVGNTNKKRARRIILLLITGILLVSGLTLYLLHKEGVFYNNCVVPITDLSEEGKAANLVWEGGANLYRYYSDKDYNQLQIKCYRYKNDVLIDEMIIANYDFKGDYSGEGMLAIIDDYDTGTFKINLHAYGNEFEYGNDGVATKEYSLPLGDMDLFTWQETYCQMLSAPINRIKLDDGEAGLLFVAYDKGTPEAMPKSVAKDGFWPKGAEKCPGIEENDYTDYFTIKFNKN